MLTMTKWSRWEATQKLLQMKVPSVDQNVGVTGGAATEMAATGMPVKAKPRVKRARHRPSAKPPCQRLRQRSSKFSPSRLKCGNGNHLPPQ